jgi:magnesium-transporting ATPase (P-type)
VALLKLLQDAELPIQDDIRAKFGNVLYQVPFNSTRKNSAIAVKKVRDDGSGEYFIRIFVKGAPEQMIFNCNQSFDQSG